jgi:hypothetical protein
MGGREEDSGRTAAIGSGSGCRRVELGQTRRIVVQELSPVKSYLIVLR